MHIHSCADLCAIKEQGTPKRQLTCKYTFAYTQMRGLVCDQGARDAQWLLEMVKLDAQLSSPVQPPGPVATATPSELVAVAEPPGRVAVAERSELVAAAVVAATESAVAESLTGLTMIKHVLRNNRGKRKEKHTTLLPEAVYRVQQCETAATCHLEDGLTSRWQVAAQSSRIGGVCNS